MSTSDSEQREQIRVSSSRNLFGCEVIRSAFFPLTDWIVLRSFKIEHWRFDAINQGQSVSYIAIQGSASVPGVHARSSGSPMDYCGAHLRES
jgi:hypothetical protein